MFLPAGAPGPRSIRDEELKLNPGNRTTEQHDA
jgi:hypothetical protein